MINKIFLFLLVFPILNIQAASLMGFCFGENVSLDNVEMTLGVLVHGDDKIFKRPANNCIEINGSPARANLYEIFLNKKFNIIRSYGTESVNSEISSAPACKINIKKSSTSFQS